MQDLHTLPASSKFMNDIYDKVYDDINEIDDIDGKWTWTNVLHQSIS